MRFTILFFAACFALYGCANSSDAQPQEEKIEEKYPSGQPKRVSYFDLATKELVTTKDLYQNSKTYREFHFKSGLRNGECKAFYENGNPWSINNYVNDTLNGAYKTYHENGQVYISGEYEMGLRAGVWQFFNPQGQLLKEVSFIGLPDSLRADK